MSLPSPRAGVSAYRLTHGSAEACPRLRALLAAAREALALANHVVDDAPADETPAELSQRVSRLREHLYDAVIALGHAKVYLPKVQSYHPLVVLESFGDERAEFERLVEIRSRLLWRNGPLMPAPARSEPLSVDDEAALVELTTCLSRRQAFSQLGRYGGVAAAVSLVAVAPMLGPLYAIAGLGVAAVASVRLWQQRESS